MTRPALAARVAAVTALAKAYRGKPAKIGGRDCIKAALFTVRKRKIALPALKGLRYSGAPSARKALAARGYDDLLEAVDAQGFERIALARAWPGDFVAFTAPNYAPPFDVALYVVQYAGGEVLFGVDPVTLTFQSAEWRGEAPLAVWRV